MASATKQGSIYRFEWRDPYTGETRRVGLSGVNKRAADQIKGWIQDLADSLKTGTTPPTEARSWLLQLPPDIHAKFAKAGLVQARKARTLEAFAKDFIERKRGSVCEATIFRYEMSSRDACYCFGKERDISTITVGDALDFHRWVQKPRMRWDVRAKAEKMVRGLTGSTPNKRCEDMAVIFEDAKRHRLISENPFADRSVPKATKPASEEKRHFVTHEEALKILGELADQEVRTMFAFARWCGTRHTEPLGIKLEHVHFGVEGRPGHVMIPCDKTAKKTGKAFRKCPLFPEVERELLKLVGKLPDGADYLFRHYRPLEANASTSMLKKAMRRAGLSWTAPWQNLRRTRATELAETEFPSFAVSEWMGHTEAVADAHYRRTSDGLLARAAAFQTGAKVSGGGGGGDPPKAVENGGFTAAPTEDAEGEGDAEKPREFPKKSKKPLENKGFHDRGGRIRTDDIRHPKTTLYQAELHPGCWWEGGGL